MYKDGELQKEKMKLVNQKARLKKKGISQGISQGGISVPKGNENAGETQGVTYLINDNGGKFRLDMVVDSSWRELLGYLVSHINPEHMGSLRVGVDGWTIREARGLLEVTDGKAA